jgi:hypothetical protein
MKNVKKLLICIEKIADVEKRIERGSIIEFTDTYHEIIDGAIFLDGIDILYESIYIDKETRQKKDAVEVILRSGRKILCPYDLMEFLARIA